MSSQLIHKIFGRSTAFAVVAPVAIKAQTATHATATSQLALIVTRLG
jgi:hypothetical protein